MSAWCVTGIVEAEDEDAHLEGPRARGSVTLGRHRSVAASSAPQEWHPRGEGVPLRPIRRLGPSRAQAAGGRASGVVAGRVHVVRTSLLPSSVLSSFETSAPMVDP